MAENELRAELESANAAFKALERERDERARAASRAVHEEYTERLRAAYRHRGDALSALNAHIAEAERAAVVAWLLAEAENYREDGHETDAVTLEIAASEVVACQHLSGDREM
jgi:hypothetical protein